LAKGAFCDARRHLPASMGLRCIKALRRLKAWRAISKNKTAKTIKNMKDFNILARGSKKMALFGTTA
jgi:hypothetical protein